MVTLASLVLVLRLTASHGAIKTLPRRENEHLSPGLTLESVKTAWSPGPERWAPGQWSESKRTGARVRAWGHRASDCTPSQCTGIVTGRQGCGSCAFRVGPVAP